MRGSALAGIFAGVRPVRYRDLAIDLLVAGLFADEGSGRLWGLLRDLLLAGLFAGELYVGMGDLHIEGAASLVW